MTLDPIKFSQELIRISSVSGNDSNIISFFAENVKKMGFEVDILRFDGDGGSYAVDNLHAVFNPKNKSDVLYFAGHLDVVDSGDVNLWKYDPYLAKIDNDILYGRGVVDMKCAIACFVSAVSEFLMQNPKPDFGIGLLITGDEEAESINGTKKVLDWMKSNNKIISNCLVGEPTSSSRVGDVIKIGRRGSVSFSLKVNGKQGHVAYPQHAINPITTLNNMIKILNDYNFDQGNSFFDPSNLEFTSISSPNNGSNVIPGNASANFNVRFNDEHNSKSIIDFVEYVCSKTVMNGSYDLTYRVSGESFLTKPGFLSDLVSRSINKVVNFRPEISTSGGTSDARFIKDFCPVVEIGMMNKTAHQIDECAHVSDIIKLKNIYKEILNSYDKK